MMWIKLVNFITMLLKVNFIWNKMILSPGLKKINFLVRKYNNIGTKVMSEMLIKCT